MDASGQRAVVTGEPGRDTGAGGQDPLGEVVIRHDYSRDELLALYELPLPTLLLRAQAVHARQWPGDEVELATLLSVKTGGCKEDCAYCPQSAHHQGADVDAHGLLDLGTILTAARRAQAGGATRFCMGAAWRSPPVRGDGFERILQAVRGVAGLGLEVCVTLGMLSREQCDALAAAGAHTVNHNLDTSPEYYGDVISTRTYGDRLATLAHVRASGMRVCCGGIVGMGESRSDRLGLLAELSALKPHPESVPVNMLVRVAGTPLAGAEPLDIFELVRTIAVARIIMPASRVRLSAGRTEMSDEAQALCFMAGANSIFVGERLLTTPNPAEDADRRLLARLGLKPTAGTAQPPVH